MSPCQAGIAPPAQQPHLTLQATVKRLPTGSGLAARLSAVTAGLTAEKVALLIVVGLVLGTFPVLGCATLLCALAAVIFRMNLPALQVMNQIATPAQYALLLPFARVGARVVGSGTGIAAAVAHAIAGWFCIAVPLGIVLYFALLYLLRARLHHTLNELERAV